MFLGRGEVALSCLRPLSGIQLDPDWMPKAACMSSLIVRRFVHNEKASARRRSPIGSTTGRALLTRLEGEARVGVEPTCIREDDAGFANPGA
jgi:hypothetical protein